MRRDHDTRAAAPPLHQLLDRVRQRQPATEGAGGRVWRDDAEVVLTRVAPLLAVTLLALCAVLVALGWLVTDVLDDSAFGWADLALVRDLAENRTGALDAVTGAATWLATTTFVLAVMVGGAVVAARRTRRWSGRADAETTPPQSDKPPSTVSPRRPIQTTRSRPDRSHILGSRTYSATPAGHLAACSRHRAGSATMSPRRAAPGRRMACMHWSDGLSQ